MLNIGEAIPWYLCMFLSFSCEWRSSVVQARMCKLGRDPLIFLKILVVIGHVCIYWSKVAEGFSVFNAVLFSLKFLCFDIVDYFPIVCVETVLCTFNFTYPQLINKSNYQNGNLFTAIEIWLFVSKYYVIFLKKVPTKQREGALLMTIYLVRGRFPNSYFHSF